MEKAVELGGLDGRMRESESAPDKPIALIVAASARYLTDSAVAAGYQVVAIDQFGDVDLQQSSLHWSHLKNNAWDACVIRVLERLALERFNPRKSGVVVCGGGYENNLHQLANVQPKLCDLGWISAFTDPVLARRVREPDFIEPLARHAGFAVPARAPLRNDLGADSQHWLEKRVLSSAGLGIRHGQAGEIDSSEDLSGPYLQRRVYGRPLGVTLLISSHRLTLLGFCRSMTIPCAGFPFLYAGSIGPVEVHAQTRIATQRLGKNLHRLGLRGLLTIDCIEPVGQRKGTAPWFLEINPRPSASLEILEAAHQASLFAAHVACFDDCPRTTDSSSVDDTPPPLGDDASSLKTAKFIFWTGKQIQYYHSLLSHIEREIGPFDSLHRWHDLPRDGSQIPAGAPVATLTVSDPSSKLLRHIRRIQLQFCRP